MLKRKMRMYREDVLEELSRQFKIAATQRINFGSEFVTMKVDGMKYDDIGMVWCAYERMHMFATINRLRADSGKPPIAFERVVRVERMAAGHVDYSNKFMLYCMELVCNEDKEIEP